MPQTNPWDHEKITIHIGVWPSQWHIKSPGMPDANPTTLEDMRVERDRRATYYANQGYYVTYLSTTHNPDDYVP